MNDIPAFSQHAHASIPIGTVNVAKDSAGEFKILVAESSEALVRAYLEKRAVALPNGDTRKAADLFSVHTQYNGDVITIQLAAQSHAWHEALLPQKEQMAKNFLDLLPAKTTMKQKFTMLVALACAKIIMSKEQMKETRDALFGDQEAYFVHKSLVATAHGWLDDQGVERLLGNSIALNTEENLKSMAKEAPPKLRM